MWKSRFGNLRIVQGTWHPGPGGSGNVTWAQAHPRAAIVVDVLEPRPGAGYTPRKQPRVEHAGKLPAQPATGGGFAAPSPGKFTSRFGTADWLMKDKPSLKPTRHHPRTNTDAGGYQYLSPNVPMAAIHRFARQLGERFDPVKIILFGSYAYGQPHRDSDVDLLAVMPAANEINQAIRLTLAFEPPFSLDLIVRTPEHLRRALEEDDWFLSEVVSKGKVLYEKIGSAMGAQGGGRSRRRKKPGDEIRSRLRLTP